MKLVRTGLCLLGKSNSVYFWGERFDRQYCAVVLSVASFRMKIQTVACCMYILNEVFLINAKISQMFRRTGSSHSLPQY